MEAVPIRLQQVHEFVARHHRHNKPTVGVLPSLAALLGQAGFSLLTVSTFDTNSLPVKENGLMAALNAFR